MPVLPNNPPIPLWVLRTVPKDRSRAVGSTAVREGVLRVLPFAALALLAAVILHDSQALPAVVFLGLVFVGQLVAQVAPTVAARRWLDRNGRWEDVARLGWDAESERSQRWWENGMVVGLIALLAAVIAYIALWGRA
jgi:hypothetical protein